MHLPVFGLRGFLRQGIIRTAKLSRGTCRFTNDHTKFRVKELPEFFEKYLSHEVAAHGHKKVMLIRHGQSIGNQKELLYGALDFELTAKGKKQAEHMKEQLGKFLDKFDTVTSSTKRRALETAKILLHSDTPLEKLKDGHSEKRGHVEFRVDKRFDEFDLGGMEGICVSALTFAEQEFINKL